MGICTDNLPILDRETEAQALGSSNSPDYNLWTPRTLWCSADRQLGGRGTGQFRHHWVTSAVGATVGPMTPSSPTAQRSCSRCLSLQTVCIKLPFNDLFLLIFYFVP